MKKDKINDAIDVIIEVIELGKNEGHVTRVGNRMIESLKALKGKKRAEWNKRFEADHFQATYDFVKEELGGRMSIIGDLKTKAAILRHKIGL